MSVIGFVLAEFPVLSETFVGNEMRAMAGMGHRVVPIGLRKGTGKSQPDDAALAAALQVAPALSHAAALATLARLGPSAAAAGIAFALAQEGLPRTSLLWNALKIARIAADAGCDHLHAHFAGPAAAHAIVAARMLGIGCSFMCHGYDVYQSPCDLRLKLEAADFVGVTCEDMAADMAAVAPEARLCRIPCGIDPARFAPRATAASNGRLLYVGRLVEQKGLDDLFDAYARLPASVRPGLDIVGDGPLLAPLMSQADRLGIAADVAFLGSRTSGWLATEGPAYMAFVSAFKVAADGQRDTGPVTIKEAMAMGLPVVATAHMGVKENVLAGMGELVTPGDLEALAAALLRLVTASDAERVAMGRRGRAHVAGTFSLDACASRLTDAIAATARSAAARPAA